jgi:hypothetical protein
LIKVPAPEQKKMLHLLGLTYVNADFFSSTICGIALTFVNKLVSGFRPKTEQWDLEEWSHLPLASAQHLKLFHCICPDLFLLDYGQALMVRWKLTVTNAEDALYVCQLAPCLNEYDIACKLVQQGMQFRTLLPLKEILRSPIVTNHILPIRLPGYKFTPKDYKAYQHQCQVIFSQP